MSLQTRIALSLAAAALWQAPAVAADYEPPIIVDNAPEYVPVEVGSGWYLRGDIGYNLNKSVYDIDFLDTDSTRFNGGIGVGYHLNDYLRTELNLGFVSQDKYQTDLGPFTVSAKNSVWSGMVNGYYDLATISGFTPYIGGGLGLLHSRSEVTVDDVSVLTDRQYELAYSLAAGVNYQVSKNVSMDLGYQYLSSPDTKYFNIDTGLVEDGIDYHQIKVGLRYDLW
ncbi:porin family protein [Pseudaminobacter arsenicus]|uniref:Porin family protein n=1 Tax=Borborobacter arsenicus TaxID=1851146 RepID=A0A432V0E7_9HYPH|nr:outer membrane protein [Pseudaminobacter arsenicus]RUM95684.1 porin family protein [Pseudaminobacter arsenicus]